MASYPRLLQPPRSSFFLFGPRGSGKSTWLSQNFARSATFDLLDEELFQQFLREPSAFGRALTRLEKGQWVVVDEIQRLPPLLNEVHRAIESKKLRFALCGSSARKLRRAGVNLLAGRALQMHMHPFVPEEMGKDFDIDTALEFGSLPVVLGSSDRPRALSSYAQLYLREEVQAEALVRNLAGFSRFLTVTGVCHGQVLNLSNVARDSGVARMTVDTYLSVLEDTLLAYRLPAFETKLRVRERQHPKLYFVDPGIARAVRQDVGPPGSEQKGHLFEGFVGGLLRAYMDYRELGTALAYWSPAGTLQTEVDFVVSRGPECIAIEAKSARTLAVRDFAGLRAFAKQPGLRRRIVVHTGRLSGRTEDGIDTLTIADFAAELAAGTLWSRPR